MNFFDKFFDVFFPIFFTVLLIITLISIPFMLIKEHDCSVYCNNQNKVCADYIVGSEHYICYEPNLSNVRFVEER